VDDGLGFSSIFEAGDAAGADALDGFAIGAAAIQGLHAQRLSDKSKGNVAMMRELIGDNDFQLHRLVGFHFGGSHEVDAGA
jgi:hypothetical protein